MKIVIVLLALTLCSCSTVSFDSRLNGTWVSNRDETMVAAFQKNDHAEKPPTITRETLKSILGKLRLTYDENRVTTRYENNKETFTYKVLSRGAGYVQIETRSNGDRVRHRIEFTKDQRGYWVQTPMGYKEKFDRISAP